jgi:hypothetical protein
MCCGIISVAEPCAFGELRLDLALPNASGSTTAANFTYIEHPRIDRRFAQYQRMK